MGAGGLLAALLAAAAAVCLGSGCSTLGYYGQAIGGHLSLLQRTQPVDAVINDPATPTPLRERLALSQRMRDFAISELRLPDNRSYRRYADLERSSVVWNVVATPELSLTLKTWCFPIVGCVGYRGYYTREAAEALAAELIAQGLETSVYGVPAYSTLGKTDWLGGDPLLNTFIQWPEAELAKLIFHELAHQIAYADDDTMFNESFAVAVERIGGSRWLERHASAETRTQFAASETRRREFRALTLAHRQRLRTLYEGPLPDAEKRAAKAALAATLRAEYEAIKATRWGGFAGYDGWIARANNASFAVQAAYDELVGDFERLFEKSGRDFERFYAEVRALAKAPKEERRRRLTAP
jgi:predicted aminopeptidase